MHSDEVVNGQRFEFGLNWRAFLSTLDDQRINSAQNSIDTALGRHRLADKTFLDVGCGSGLFSLAARRSGARVHSVDYDPESVACTAELKRRYFPNDGHWTVGEGSALDAPYFESLGQFDVVYSWGVLHHTGDMWKAIDLAAARVKGGGTLFISIYNDQGGGSRRWLKIKQIYNGMARLLRPPLVLLVALPYEAKFALARLANGLNPLPFSDWRRKKEDRGMSVWHDWVDWCGGLPFQVAKPEEVLSFLRKRDFILEDLTTCGGGWGCNQFVFRRATGADEAAGADPRRIRRSSVRLGVPFGGDRYPECSR